MNKYAEAALRAVTVYKSGSVSSPNDAWERVTTEIFGRGTASQVKGCPRDAFLGLCQEGLVVGIPAGNYTRSAKNKNYAVNSIGFLKESPDLAQNWQVLWRLVSGGSDKKHNSQMNVVIALWNENLIR